MLFCFIRPSMTVLFNLLNYLYINYYYILSEASQLQKIIKIYFMNFALEAKPILS